jgi:hypothetical protein
MSAAAFVVDSDCIGNRVVIADESTCLMMTQSAADTPDAPPLAAELTADAIADTADDTAAGALVAGALGEVELAELPQAASAAQMPPATNTAIARRGPRARDGGARTGFVALNISVSFSAITGAQQDVAGHIGVPTALVRSLVDGSSGNRSGEGRSAHARSAGNRLQ